MKRHEKKRIQNANKYLPFFLKEGEEFYVGVLFEDYLKCPHLAAYSLPKTFNQSSSVVPLPKGSTTRANKNGKYGRKQPEEKETKTVHIKYYRKKDERLIEYDRDFYVYVKELKHKLNLPLTFFQNKHGQKVVVSTKQRFDNEEVVKNTHAINIFCEIFNDFEVFNTELEPAIHFNKRFEEDILPSGTLAEGDTFNEIVKFAGKYTKDEEAEKAFQKRLHILKKFNPDIRGKGPNNFFGYIAFDSLI